ncbi:PIN domain-containing protein [Nodosilinea sp. LEGE 07088]|uniref:type II toxin-antitoxin system VapC family toxin n=1 Tax=Nodosilinea sp. LEGE 07088 TaxID=2777968 RepID=UPI0018826A0F|nr:PIN domain-containing protein [Nodosilinea sp. LEGE 07088]MBE9136929.1 PIN domain-containing protein [Nodosilinea sp. LEGE 07088]
MNRLFVDTSAFAALADRDDDNHASAVAFNKQMKGHILVSTNYILDELYTLLLLHAGYPKTVSFKADLDILVAKGLLRIVWISDAIAQSSWEVFEQFNTDKEWSFTDCTSYVVMKQHRLTEVFTFDHHFSQMGFTRLPI